MEANDEQQPRNGDDLRNTPPTQAEVDAAPIVHAQAAIITGCPECGQKQITTDTKAIGFISDPRNAFGLKCGCGQVYRVMRKVEEQARIITPGQEMNRHVRRAIAAQQRAGVFPGE